MIHCSWTKYVLVPYFEGFCEGLFLGQIWGRFEQREKKKQEKKKTQLLKNLTLR